MIQHPTKKETHRVKLNVNRALRQLQFLYDEAELGNLNFKFPSPYNWHLMKQHKSSLGDSKNVPAIKKLEDEINNEPTPTAE